MEPKDAWSLILQINEMCRKVNDLNFISVKRISEAWMLSCHEALEDQDMYIKLGKNVPDPTDASVVVQAATAFSVEFDGSPLFDQPTEQFLQDYLAYSFLPCFAHRQGKVLVISHFAQTLDGKIASVTGDSRWIGNEENLIHAHRMRALCDAVLVGATTYKVDQPRLNVRHVRGTDPLKVIVGSHADEAYFQTEDKVFINTSDFDVMDSGRKDVSQILRALHDRGVSSVYLEGGATTTSSFLNQGAVDQLQIHFSCKILGSGKQGYHFEGIDTIEECIRFKNPRFVPMGNEMMFLGEL